jgi:hypothetical protein
LRVTLQAIKTYEDIDEATGLVGHTRIPGFDMTLLALAETRSRMSFDDAVSTLPRSTLTRFLNFARQHGIALPGDSQS